MLVQNLLGLVDLQKSSLDFIPGLAGNSDERLGSKRRRAVRRSALQNGTGCPASVSTETQIPFFPPFLLLQNV